MEKIVIAIDGHSSTGKSTVAKSVAKHLSYIYIDSGAMYRCVTLFGLESGWIKNEQIDKRAIVRNLPTCEIKFESVNDMQHAFLNGKDVESEIRSLYVSQNVSAVATIKEVREFLVAQQQKMGEQKGIVMDGRDIGTVVFPQAELKIFMTASADVRAKRRFDEMKSKGEQHNYEDILQNVIERDRIDENRKESPLRKAEDAILLDNGGMSRDEQLSWILEKVEEVMVTC